jgi:hypothetical protein
MRLEQYVLRKLRAWYAMLPLTPRVGGGTASDAAEEGTGGAAPDSSRRMEARMGLKMSAARRLMPFLIMNKYCCTKAADSGHLGPILGGQGG